MFSEFRKTKYAEKFSLANGLTQDSVLGWKLEDLGHSHEVQDALASNTQCRIFFPDNPCHLGFQFMGIQQGMLVCTVVSLLHLYHFEHRCSAFLSLLYDSFGMNFNQSLKQVNSTRCRGPSWSQTLAQWIFCGIQYTMSIFLLHQFGWKNLELVVELQVVLHHQYLNPQTVLNRYWPAGDRHYWGQANTHSESNFLHSQKWEKHFISLLMQPRQEFGNQRHFSTSPVESPEFSFWNDPSHATTAAILL